MRGPVAQEHLLFHPSYFGTACATRESFIASGFSQPLLYKWYFLCTFEISSLQYSRPSLLFVFNYHPPVVLKSYVKVAGYTLNSKPRYKDFIYNVWPIFAIMYNQGTIMGEGATLKSEFGFSAPLLCRRQVLNFQ